MTMERILVLSPHADDAELGCGGSIIKFIECEREVYSVIFSTCEESLPKNMHKKTLEDEAKSAHKMLGLAEDRLITYDHRVRSFPAIRQEILDSLIHLKKDISPDLVILPSLNDYHQDHQVLANEAVRAFKTTASMISYELPWNHINFQTQMFVSLEKRQVELKYKILQEYKSQLVIGREYFSKEFIYGLGKVRGAQCNSEYAEAFEVIRWRV
jgi:N-acetylglucosamine malate deacetylase 1